jgi:hypothetical protein
MIRKAMASIGSLCLVLACAAAIPAPAADGGEQGTDPAADREAEGEEASDASLSPLIHATGGKSSATPVKVYTNEDLKRVSGTGPGPAETTLPPSPASEPATGGGAEPEPPSAAGEPTSALDELFAREARRQEHVRLIALAEERVATAKQRVADFEKRMLAIRNPLLARPKPPEDEEEATAWQDSDATGRVQQTEGQLEAARAEVAQAERDLAELRRAGP